MSTDRLWYEINIPFFYREKSGYNKKKRKDEITPYEKDETCEKTKIRSFKWTFFPSRQFPPFMLVFSSFRVEDFVISSFSVVLFRLFVFLICPHFVSSPKVSK